MATYSMEPVRSSPYSEDLRWRMVYQHEVLGLSYRKIAGNLNVDHSTVNRVVARFQAIGDVTPTRQPGKRSDLTTIDELVILENVIERPGTYLQELQTDLLQVTGTDVSVSTICRFLKRSNFSRKKLSRIARQRNDELRATFRSDCSVYKPEILLFLDESGTDRRHSLRKYGYSIVGKPALCTSLLLRGTRYSVIAAMSLHGIVDTYITSGTVSADDFQDFIDKSLLRHTMPFDGFNPNSVVILDNASIHHVHHIVETIESVGVLLHFYQPTHPT